MGKVAMLERRFFHFKIQVIRPGREYGINKGAIKSTAHFFVPQDGGPFISIGSGPQDYIHVKDLADNHVTCGISGNEILVTAQSPLEINAGGSRCQITAGQKWSLPLPTVASFSPIEWQMVFPDRTAVIGRINKEGEHLAPDARNYLEHIYGPMEKMWEGESSVIYKTHDDRVVKILRPSYAAWTKGAATRFLNAIRKVQRLSGGVLPKINEVGYKREYLLHYVVMEYIEAESLANYLAGKGSLPRRQAAAIVKNLAKSLHHLQKHRYCLRNLSPQNILVQKDDQVKITGFFLLKSDVNLTGKKTRMIVPNYSSPEQVEDPACADIAADVFSLGSIFHTLLTGEPPFGAKDPVHYADILSAKPKVRAQDVHSVAPFLPQRWCEVVASMLSLDKGERPGPGEIISRLEELEKEDHPGPTPKMLFSGEGEENEVEGGCFTASFSMLLNKVDKMLDTQIGEVLQDSERELSQEHVDCVEEMRITDHIPSGEAPKYRPFHISSLSFEDNKHMQISVDKVLLKEAQLVFSLRDASCETQLSSRCYPLNPSKTIYQEVVESALALKEDVFNMFPHLRGRAGNQVDLVVLLIGKRREDSDVEEYKLANWRMNIAELGFASRLRRWFEESVFRALQ